MKILILGNFDYTNELIYRLKGSRFLVENQIDFMYSVPKKIKLSKKIKLLFKKLTLNKLITRLILFFNKESNEKIIVKLFPPRDISFIETYKNLRKLNYSGLTQIEDLECYDFMIVSTFSEKIPMNIINKPKCGTLNIHPSLLPKLRGGYPTYVGAYLSTKYSGTTIHYMQEKWDNGDIIIQEEYKLSSISKNNDRLISSANSASKLLNELHLLNYNFSSHKQNTEDVTYCHNIIKFKSFINSIPSSESFTGVVNANYAKHLFPFTYLIVYFRIFSIISVQYIDMSTDLKFINYSNHKLISDQNKYFIKHDNKCYEITEYLWKGKHYIQD